MAVAMTPEQRLDRAERILVRMVEAGRRTRSEWQYKINSLVDAQIRHEAQWRIESEKIDEQLKEVATAQARNDIAIARLAKSHELTEKALRAFIKSMSKGHNGES
jgi:hypothetical protein